MQLRVGFLLVLGLAIGCIPGTAGVARADAVTDWAGIVSRADEATKEEGVAALRAPSRSLLAMFEAANAVDPHYVSFLGTPAAPSGADVPLAVASAARTVLTASYKAGVPEAERAYAAALARVPEGPSRATALAVGQDAARRAMAAGGLDPERPAAPYRPQTQPGVWIPTTQPSLPPLFQSLKPWFMAHADSLRPPPPPALTSPVYQAAFEETKALGGLHSTLRTTAQTRQAQFWRHTDEDAVLAQVSGRPGRGLVQNARFYAVAALAADDTGSAVVDAKMHYNFWRPITAIRNAGKAGEPGWEPLLTTPMHPEYVCGHCVHGATIAAILEAEAGMGPASRLRFASKSLPGQAEEMSLEQSVSACSLSRIYGGVHFRFSAEAGEKLGYAVVALAEASFATPLRQ